MEEGVQYLRSLARCPAKVEFGIARDEAPLRLRACAEVLKLSGIAENRRLTG